MARTPQRLIGTASGLLGIALFVLSVAWLVSNGDNGDSSKLKFLPQRHEEFFLEAGSIKLQVSITHLVYFVLAIAILLIACGKFLIRRDRLNRLRS